MLSIKVMHHDILVPGHSLSFDGGFFGLSSIVLIEGDGFGPILFDCGHHVTRNLLLEALAERNMRTDDVETLVLSHLHFDHANNIDLFPRARIVISAAEWDYASKPAREDIFVATAVRNGLARARVTLVEGDGEIVPGLRHLSAPGHTPGHIALAYTAGDGAHITLAADAVKTAREAMSGIADIEFDSRGRASETIRMLVSGSDIIVPGHHPEIHRSMSGWTWQTPSRLTLVTR